MPVDSRRCKGCNQDDAVDSILVAAAAIGAPEDVVRSAIDAVLVDHQKLMSAHNWLHEVNALTAADPGPKLLQDLRNYLADAGYGTPATCATCGRRKALNRRNDAGRVCGACYARSRATETCVVCGRDKTVAWRDEERGAWCSSCRRTHPDAWDFCCRCGTHGLPALRTPEGPVGYCCYERTTFTCDSCSRDTQVHEWRDGKPICQSCHRLTVAECGNCGAVRPLRTGRTAGRSRWCIPCLSLPLGDFESAFAAAASASCADCGRQRKIQAYLPDGPRCSTCYYEAIARRGTCSECGVERRLFFWPGKCASCLNVDIGLTCRTCGLEDRIYTDGECPRCALASEVDRQTEDLGELGRAVAGVLKKSGEPLARLQWLRRGRAWARFRDIATTGSVSHELLDGLPRTTRRDGRSSAGHDIEYLRALLVAADVLEPRDELTSRYQRWAQRRIEAVPSPSTRWLLARFHREKLLPTVEYQSARGKATVGTVRWAQARLRATELLLAWLAPHGGPSSLNRALLDEWLSASTTRYLVRDFVRWGIRQKIISLPLKASPARSSLMPAQYADEDERGELARKFLSDTTVPDPERVVGALVVLYGQHLTRISTLSSDRVRTGPVRVRLGGRDWLEVPAPLDQPVARLKTAADERGDGWLFPGEYPGEHLSVDVLSEVLEGHGVNARTMRNAALFHLAGTVQSHTLARLLGLHPNTAARWVQVANGIYSTYWSELVADGEDWDVDAVDGEEVSGELLDDLGLADTATDGFWDD